MASRILLVDDEPELLRALCVRLTAAGFVCESAADGKEALAKTQRWHPDLIIADLVMPHMDGYEMCRQLKSDEQTAAIPVVVLTAVPEHALGQRAKELGAVRIMHKPFDSVELVSTVRDVIGHIKPGGPRHG
jgi:CheY-like chemotaxis protein